MLPKRADRWAPSRRQPRFIFPLAASLVALAALSLDEFQSHAAPREQSGDRAGDANDVIVEVFYRPDSELSTKALELLEEIERQPGVRVKKYDVLADNDALKRLWKLAKRQGVDQPTVPAYFAYGQIKFGFADKETTRREIEELYTIHAYTREGCPHCRDAKAFLKQLQQRRPGIRVVIHDVVSEPGARDRMNELSRRFGIPATGLPCFYVCGRFMVGFNTAQTTGRQLEALFQNPKEEKPAAKPGAGYRPSAVWRVVGSPPSSGVRGLHLTTAAKVSLMRWQTTRGPERSPIDVAPANDAAAGDAVPAPEPASEAVPPPADLGEANQEPSETASEEEPQIELPLFGPIRLRDWGLPGFTFLVGLVDGFNPCAMWVLVFLLSVLVNLRDRKKILIVAGTFVFISGLAYFLFMTAWLNVFVLIGWARPTQIALGLLATFIGLINVKDFVAFGRGVSFSIPESAKPGIYARVRRIVTAKYLTAALVGAAALAVVVNVIELLCTAGLPAMYTQILTLQELPAWKNYLYLGLYIVAYMFDDTIMLALAVVTLSHRRMQEGEGRWLKLVSGLVILALGLAMIFRPEWLE
ncbi:MAG TPA: glutaredoxin [Pirellulales bacterium]|nr:glutaredoxin [Pirellulales bacterium]